MAKKKPINQDDVLCLRVPSAIIQAYKELAQETGSSASKLQRKALVEYLEKEGIKTNGNTESMRLL